MKKKSILYYVFLFICCISIGWGIYSLYAQDLQSWQAWDFVDYKNEIVESVYSDVSLLPLIDVDEAKITLTDLSNSFQKLSDQYFVWDETRQELEDEYIDVQLSIERIIVDMDRTKSQAKENITKINLMKQQIQNLLWELKALKISLSQSERNIRSYTTFLYKLQNEYYGQDMRVSDIKLFAKSDNITTSLSTDGLVQMLTFNLAQLLDVIQTKKEQHEEKIRVLHQSKLEQQKLSGILAQDLKQLQDQRKYFYELMSYLQSSREQADEKIGLLQASRTDLADQINMLRQATQANAASSLTPWSRLYDLLQLKDRGDGDTYFSWPVMPVEEVMYHFQDPLYIQDYGEQNDNMILQVKQWEEIYAPAPGIVYKVNNVNGLELNWLVLIHKHWYITFYEPLSEIYVQEWQMVQRWQIIGMTWGQPGTRGAWLEAVWPRLHMEILKNGEPVDPFMVMDISIFKDKDTLPQIYRVKYLQDYFAREVALNNLPKVYGNTIEERRDSFLNTYAPAPYNDPWLWYEWAQSTWIDPIFGICIGFAETSFKNFKSTNNIGNVGNDDSGNTREYASPLAGIKALYNVLNNRFLWWYYTINQLSRFGNDDGYIYASSPYNRQKNIMKCMSAIYAYPVPEDYPIRRIVK